MSPIQEAIEKSHQLLKRSYFLQTCATRMDIIALGSMMECLSDKEDIIPMIQSFLILRVKAKSVIGRISFAIRAF